MKEVYVFIAEGFEEIEALTVVDLLRRGGIETYTVSITENKQVMGSHEIKVTTDYLFEELDFTDAAMLVLPGGLPGTNHLEAHDGLINLIQDFHQKGKNMAAICVAPSILANLDILQGVNATCHPSYEERIKAKGVLYSYEQVVVSDTIITSRGLGTAVPFSLAIISKLLNQDIADRVKKAIVY